MLWSASAVPFEGVSDITLTGSTTDHLVANIALGILGPVLLGVTVFGSVCIYII
jgi:hypothetical protein